MQIIENVDCNAGMTVMIQNLACVCNPTLIDRRHRLDAPGSSWKMFTLLRLPTKQIFEFLNKTASEERTELALLLPLSAPRSNLHGN